MRPKNIGNTTFWRKKLLWKNPFVQETAASKLTSYDIQKELLWFETIIKGKDDQEIYGKFSILHFFDPSAEHTTLE